MSAAALEIPKEQWQAYFNDVSKQHQGWAVTIEVLAGELGDQRHVDGLPLSGLSFDPAGSQAGDILVETGDAGTPFDTHLVHRPRAVRSAVLQPGAEMDIEIESEEGYQTIVHIRLRPELPAPGDA
jgi:hypothetical protein